MAIPDELKRLRQWVLWKYNYIKGEPKKMFFCLDGSPAKSNDASTWNNYETLRAIEGYDGLAFVISKDDPYCGVDLDDCLDKSGRLAPQASKIVSIFEDSSYCEISPSGEGLKLTTRAKKPGGSRCAVKLDDGSGLECYDHTRFWCFTGNVFINISTIRDGQSDVDWLISEYLYGEPRKTAAPRLESQGGSFELLRRGEAYVDGCRPASKGTLRNTAFSISGHLHAIVDDFGGKLSDTDVFGLLRRWNCTNSTQLRDDELREAAVNGRKNGRPPADKPPEDKPPDVSGVDISHIIKQISTKEDVDEESFCLQMLPNSGLLRLAFEHYEANSHRMSNVMGLAMAISLCETIFGRKIASHTDMRTNDYNVIIAPTNCGKEAVEKSLAQIVYAADPEGKCLIPPDVQSSNGLLTALSANPASCWIGDEFGKVLSEILDAKVKSSYRREIGTSLLKLYGKADSVYGGAAHAAGLKNRIVQPHLVVLGLTTGSTLFDAIEAKNISDGLIGRIAFWPVQNRPARRKMRKVPVPETLKAIVAGWINFAPGGNLATEYPQPVMVPMSQDAEKRWDDYNDAIDARMEREKETRAAIWGRVAGRAMKLALVHRLARETANPAGLVWDFVKVELEDVEWAIRLSNWLANISCDLIQQNFADYTEIKAKQAILDCLQASGGSCSKRDIERANRGLTGGDIASAAEMLQADGLITTRREGTGGRPKEVFVLVSASK